MGVGLLQQPGSLLLVMARSDSNCQDCPPVFTEENPKHQLAKCCENNDNVYAKNAVNQEKHAGDVLF